MAKYGFEFYLALNAEAPKNADRFQKSLEQAYEYGIEPIEYFEDSVLDEASNVVTTLVLVKCRERWSGAAKRFFRKTKFENLNQKVDNLYVFG